MAPLGPDAEVLGARLRLIGTTIEHLGGVRDVTAESLADDQVRRAAVERFIQTIVDLAIDVNAHLAVALGDPAPATGRDSFLALARAGVLTTDLAEQLAPAAGLRNVLVHRYTEVRLDLVASAVGEVIVGFASYVEQVARFLAGGGTS